jgi:hypothetical protein
MSEGSEIEKKKEYKNDKDKYKTVKILIRVPKWMRDTLNKKIPKNSRAETFRQMARDWLITHDEEIPVNFEELRAEADKYEADMQSLKKKKPNIDKILHKVLKGEDVQAEFIPLIIKDLNSGMVKPGNSSSWDQFTDYDVMNTIFYLKAMRAFEKAKQQLKRYLNMESGVLEEESKQETKRYIPYADLCDKPNCNAYETKQEHQERELQIEAEREAERQAEKRRDKTREENPAFQLRIISRLLELTGGDHGINQRQYDIITAYLNSYGTRSQKAMFNEYIEKKEGDKFPVPFPRVSFDWRRRIAKENEDSCVVLLRCGEKDKNLNGDTEVEQMDLGEDSFFDEEDYKDEW